MIPLDDLQAQAERYFCHKIDWKSRHKRNTVVRHAVWWAAHKLYTLTYREIGSRFGGGLDHSSVMHGVRKTQDRISEGSPELRAWAELVTGAQPADATPKPPALPNNRDYLDLLTGEIVLHHVTRTPAPPIMELLTKWKATEHSPGTDRLYIVPKDGHAA